MGTIYYTKIAEKNLFWVPQVWLKFNIFKVPRSHDIAWTSLHEDPGFHPTCLLVPALNRNYESTCIFCIVSMHSPEGNDEHELPGRFPAANGRMLRDFWTFRSRKYLENSGGQAATFGPPTCQTGVFQFFPPWFLDKRHADFWEPIQLTK